MSVFKAMSTAISTTLADQWEEVIECPEANSDFLLMREKTQTSANSSNHGNPDVITYGSVIIIPDGVADESTAAIETQELDNTTFTNIIQEKIDRINAKKQQWRSAKSLILNLR